MNYYVTHRLISISVRLIVIYTYLALYRRNVAKKTIGLLGWILYMKKKTRYHKGNENSKYIR